MKLSRRKLLFAVAVFGLACTDSTAPHTLASVFILQNINGRSLPTFLATTPGLTPTILSNTLTLFKDGTAETSEHRIEFDGTDHSITSSWTYAIHGSVIELEFDCPPNANCIAPPRGTIVGDHLALDVSGGAGSIIYNYIVGGEL